jgi:plasmid stabilization system protein ParE
MAEQELNDAAAYYSAASASLGSAFLEEVARTVEEIRAHPEAARLVTRVVRKKLVRRFPYSVLYSLPSGEVRVLAIAHQSRRPFYWRGRQ